MVLNIALDKAEFATSIKWKILVWGKIYYLCLIHYKNILKSIKFIELRQNIKKESIDDKWYLNMKKTIEI